MDASMGMDMDINMDMGGGAAKTEPSASPSASAEPDNSPMSYFAYGQYPMTIIAHIAVMILAWCFVLPAGEETIFE